MIGWMELGIALAVTLAATLLVIRAITLCSLGLIGGFFVMGWALLHSIRRSEPAVAAAAPAAQPE